MAQLKPALVEIPKAFHAVAKSRALKAGIPLKSIIYKWLQIGLAADKGREKP